MEKLFTEQVRPYYDVFISYRYRDSDLAKELEKKIRAFGFIPFLEENFLELVDRRDVTQEKVEIIRTHLSHATCLIFAYSRNSADSAEPLTEAVGSWMPWELGFFDGNVSGRIGVYLLDGAPTEFYSPQFNVQELFRGSEYLQIYESLTESNLKAFLDRNAARERRIDNVASAFIWMRNLMEESIVNPLNVALGIAEWHVDHLARYCQSQGNPMGGEFFDAMKLHLDDLRMEWSPKLRWRMGAELLGQPADSRSDGNSLSAGSVPPTPLWNQLNTSFLPGHFLQNLADAVPAASSCAPKRVDIGLTQVPGKY